jgi:hypothetical protein
MSDENNQNKQQTFPYVSYPALKAFIAHLKATVVTDQIDNTMMPRTMSGGVRAAITATLKSLGLIDVQGNTSQKLKELVEAYDTNQWPEILKKYVLPVYNDLVGSIDLKTATRKQIDDLFADATPDMKEKHIRFFLSVNREAGITYSPYLKIRRRGLSKRTSKTTPKGNDFGGQANPPLSGPTGEQTPAGMYDLPIPITSDKPSFIRIPLNVTCAQSAMVKAVLPVIDAMAKQNEESK